MSEHLPPLRQNDVGLIVAAAGCGRRFGTAQSKLLELLDGLPVLCWCLRQFAPVVARELTVVVLPSNRQDVMREALAAAGLADGLATISGGPTRQDSVARGLAALPQAAAFVAVQDAARPFSSAQLLAACITSARRHGSGVAARRVTDTVKVAAADGRVIRTPDRSQLWAAETPQVFRRALLQAAFEQVARQGLRVTDEAQAVEALGEPVFLVEHGEVNWKITLPWDLAAARGLAAARQPAAQPIHKW